MPRNLMANSLFNPGPDGWLPVDEVHADGKRVYACRLRGVIPSSLSLQLPTPQPERIDQLVRIEGSSTTNDGYKYPFFYNHTSNTQILSCYMTPAGVVSVIRSTTGYKAGELAVVTVFCTLK